ncbi:ribosome-binding factor A [Anaeromyxobacter dehalogenans 2CP-1]|uniref:Ribosome-binding factor A n=1 Tax=Anaeromyxobacter dehalogenans (strain ATCC BAA-258 / DSM 21875 / 2CP-1) TaxID=455488 RepID=B8JA31_ANAD2|nr:ribosome-binding factor A [Anaeromyxobacter dehalogenans]ACL63734.1 ribosome-binding factor A [Anaeromyxobacter dehalogenans 2CP-1]
MTPERPNRPGAPSRATPFTPQPAASAADAAALRAERLERILLALFRSVVREESTDPGLTGVDLVALRLSLDGAEARIGYALEVPRGEGQGAECEAAEALARAAPLLRARLAEVIDLPVLPSLTFALERVREVPRAPRAGAA